MGGSCFECTLRVELDPLGILVDKEKSKWTLEHDFRSGLLEMFREVGGLGGQVLGKATWF